MLPGYSKKSNLGVGLGLLCGTLYLGSFFLYPSIPFSWKGNAILTFGQIFFVWGCSMYAVGKGYHPLWGLLGLGNIVGLFILGILPDKHPVPGPKRGCLTTLGILTIFFFFVITVAYLFIHHPWSSKNTKSSEQSGDPMKGFNERMMESYTRTIVASSNTLDFRIRSFEFMVKTEPNNLKVAKDLLSALKMNINPTVDDKEVIRTIENYLSQSVSQSTSTISSSNISNQLAVSTATALGQKSIKSQGKKVYPKKKGQHAAKKRTP